MARRSASVTLPAISEALINPLLGTRLKHLR